MSELKGFPFINQRTDGDPNAEFDCVPASLAASANYLLGKPAVNDAAMKDSVYGRGYIGGTAASQFIPYLKGRGLHLYSIEGTYKDLLARTHAELAQNHPVIFTRDDPYSSDPNMTHVCVWYKDAPGFLTCMDPYGATSITMSDGQWLAHLRFQEIWILEKAMLQISDVTGFFTAQSDTAWKCKNGNMLIGAILTFYRGLPSPLALVGLPVTGEISVAGHTGVKIQVFERIVLIYDPGHVIDSPPGAGAVYAMHLDNINSPGVQQLLHYLGLDKAQDLSEVKAGLQQIEQTASSLEKKI